MMQDLINKHFYNIFLITLFFGILLYDAIGFDYTDEICALLLFLLFFIYLIRTPDWNINKAFLVTIGIFLFYLCYSLYIGSNAKKAIITDMIIQIKPYLAFFCVYTMRPQLNPNQKHLLRSISLCIWGVLLLMGIAEIFQPKILWVLMGHPTYYAAAVIVVSLCYLYTSKYTTLDKITFLAMLSIGILSGRSKFYGFYALSFFAILFISNIKQFKFNFRNTLIIVAMLALIIFVAREKVYFYFYQTVTEDVDKDMIARYVLYATSPEILKDYFPLGTGFASYATFASGVYYSKIYAEYGIDGVWGMSKDYYNFIADTYYPSLVQFGVVGIILYIFFWIYILRKSFSFYTKTSNMCLFIITFLITGFLAIEGTTDSTFTTNRGLFIMMLLGLIFSEMKTESLNQKTKENENSTDKQVFLS